MLKPFAGDRSVWKIERSDVAPAIAEGIEAARTASSVVIPEATARPGKVERDSVQTNVSYWPITSILGLIGAAAIEG